MARERTFEGRRVRRRQAEPEGIAGRPGQTTNLGELLAMPPMVEILLRIRRPYGRSESFWITSPVVLQTGEQPGSHFSPVAENALYQPGTGEPAPRSPPVTGGRRGVPRLVQGAFSTP